MRSIILLILIFCMAIACDKENEPNPTNDKDSLIEAEDTLTLVQENVNVVSHLNSPEYFDLNKDGINDIKLSMTLETRYPIDCDPVDENDTISCLPWDEYFVSVIAINNCEIADTLQETFVVIRKNQPQTYENLNWVSGSRYLVLAPFLDKGADCDSWMCEITEGYVPIRFKQDEIYLYGWVKLNINHKKQISIVQYGYYS